MLNPMLLIGGDRIFDGGFPVGLPGDVAHPVIGLNGPFSLPLAEIHRGGPHPDAIQLGSALLAGDFVETRWRLEPLQQRKWRPCRDRSILRGVTLQQHPRPGFDTGKKQTIHAAVPIMPASSTMIMVCSSRASFPESMSMSSFAKTRQSSLSKPASNCRPAVALWEGAVPRTR